MYIPIRTLPLPVLLTAVLLIKIDLQRKGQQVFTWNRLVLDERIAIFKNVLDALPENGHWFERKLVDYVRKYLEDAITDSMLLGNMLPAGGAMFFVPDYEPKR